MSYDTSDASQVKSKRRKAQLAAEREQEELKALLERPDFRYLAWKLLEYCRMFHTTSAGDATEIAVHSGLRDPGIWLLAQIMEADSSALGKMHDEAKEREKDG